MEKKIQRLRKKLACCIQTVEGETEHNKKKTKMASAMAFLLSVVAEGHNILPY